MSNMLKALTRFSRRIFFSPASTSRRPMYTSLLRLSRFSSCSQPKYSSLSSVARPVRKATGMPWTFPLPLVSGVLMSACASTQMTAISRFSLSLMALAVPPMVPMAWGIPTCQYRCSPCSLGPMHMHAILIFHYTYDGVVAAQREHQPALAGVLVGLVGDAAGDGADGLGVLHAAVGWVLALSRH